jgi:hypothetical protein
VGGGGGGGGGVAIDLPTKNRAAYTGNNEVIIKPNKGLIVDYFTFVCSN